DRVDEAGRALRELLETDVEPDGTVERGFLIDEKVLQIVAECLEIVFAREVPLRAGPGRDRVHDAADQLLDALFARGGSNLAAEVLRHHDVGRLLRPEPRNLHVPLFEDELPFLIADDRRPHLPLDLVERIDAFTAEKALVLEPRRSRRRRARSTGHRLRGCDLERPGRALAL